MYNALSLELGLIVAAKVLRPSLVDDPEFLIRFKREARAAANLSHPNIVTVHDVGQDGTKTHYIVMEYVPGQDLKQLVRAQGAFETDAALAIMIEVCKGVGYAHRAGLVHCDVKPPNSRQRTNWRTWCGAARITSRPNRPPGNPLPPPQTCIQSA